MLLQLNPNLVPTLLQTEEGVVLGDGVLPLALLLDHQPIPRHGCLQELGIGVHIPGCGLLRELDDGHHHPIVHLGGHVRGLEVGLRDLRRVGLPWAQKGHGPAHGLVLVAALVFGDPQDRGDHGRDAGLAGVPAQPIISVRPGQVRGPGHSGLGILADRVVLGTPQEDVWELAPHGSGGLGLLLQLSQEVQDALERRNRLVFAIKEVDGVPVVLLGHHLTILVQLVLTDPSEAGHGLPWQDLGTQAEHPAGAQASLPHIFDIEHDDGGVTEQKLAKASAPCQHVDVPLVLVHSCERGHGVSEGDFRGVVLPLKGVEEGCVLPFQDLLEVFFLLSKCLRPCCGSQCHKPGVGPI
mmetsp:Transcript_146252/g.255404  ORF Transcript_146252/g.255404 Transcript_146252/m.255404 type:complete len:353 (-) Transcript_146252:476-1534(-)